MIGRTIDPTMMMPPRPGSDVKSSATIAAKHQRERERMLAAVLGGEIDDRARDAGFDRHAPQQRAEDDGHIDRRELHRAAA